VPPLYIAGTRTSSEPLTFPVEGVDGGLVSMQCKWAEKNRSVRKISIQRTLAATVVCRRISHLENLSEILEVGDSRTQPGSDL